MYRVDRCLCCDGRELTRYHALVAPFIARRALGASPEPCELLECRRCGLRFFDLRFTDTELTRLYDGYRGEAYLRARHESEPWYSRALNDSLGGDEAARVRRESLESFLRQHLDTAHLETILDFGGDRGQFLPTAIGRERFVFDISGVETVAGVERVRDEELAARRFDLVCAAHVLEHLPAPSSAARRLYALDATNFYFEVPFERPRISPWLSRPVAGRWLDLVRRSDRALIGLDFVSTALRVKFSLVPPGALLKLHEHISFFTEASLTMLLERAGFEVRAVAVDASHGASDRVLRALAVKR